MVAYKTVKSAVKTEMICNKELNSDSYLGIKLIRA